MTYLTDGMSLYEVIKDVEVANAGLAGGTLQVTIVRDASRDPNAQPEPHCYAPSCRMALSGDEHFRLGDLTRAICREVDA